MSRSEPEWKRTGVAVRPGLGMIQVSVNGEIRSVPEGTSLDALVRLLELPPDRVAIEHNRRVVRRFYWESVQLGEGDRVEIVQFVGGG